ncbi:MAG: HD domain-containing protein [Saprospiraceae bacterium]|nr:HD domain-containing protein [Saprospiraceae bacterium]
MLPQVEEILAIFKKHGELNYGESMSVLSHSIQSGLIARNLGLTDSLLVAAYLHDIGHICPLYEGVKNSMMDGYGLNEHDLLGAHFLERKGFDETVTVPIRNHVASKRYLCLKDESYFSKLSTASVTTLDFQGGVMDAYESLIFENSPFFEESLSLRKIDDEAKEENFVVTDFHLNDMAEILNQYLIKLS